MTGAIIALVIVNLVIWLVALPVVIRRARVWFGLRHHVEAGDYEEVA